MDAKALVGGIVVLSLAGPGMGMRPVAASPAVSADSTSSSSIADVLAPHWQEIQQQLPPGWTLQLPHQPALEGRSPQSTDQLSYPPRSPYRVRVFTFDDASGLMISLFRCHSGAPNCLVMSLTVEDPASPAAQQTLADHQAQGTSVGLPNGLNGYQQTGTAAPASIVWQQDDLLYSVTVPDGSQQLVELARSVAIAPPLISHPPFSPVSRPSTATPLSSYLEKIWDQVPDDWGVRIPERLPDAFIQGDTAPYSVRVFAFDSPPGLAVSFFRCDSGDSACLVGSFAIDSANSPQAQQAIQQHQQSGTRLPLTDRISAHILAASQQSGTFSSLMWQQDDLIYTVSGPTQPSQPLIDLAQAIAQSPPLTQTPAIAQSPLPPIAIPTESPPPHPPTPPSTHSPIHPPTSSSPTATKPTPAPFSSKTAWGRLPP